METQSERQSDEIVRLRSFLTSIATFGYAPGEEAHHIAQLRQMARTALGPKGTA